MRFVAGAQRGPALWSSVRDRQRANFGLMPDGNTILIGHCFDVRCCFSCGCDFWLCPIVPDRCLVVLSCFIQPLIFFLCAAAKKETKKAASRKLSGRTAPHAKGAMLRVVVVGQTALRKLSQRF